MPEKRITWITADGNEFETMEAATAYEESLNTMEEVLLFLSDVLKCADRKQAEYYNVFKQYFVWRSGSKVFEGPPLEGDIKEAV